MTKLITRYISESIKDFLYNRMVFVGGPRQVGKTTSCISFLENPILEDIAYLNWDDLNSRKLLKSGLLPTNRKVFCIDEIHKFKNWRSLLKGFYDKYKNKYKFIVTGSARLDHYRRGGDSLLGRYRYIRLHPLSLGELGYNKKNLDQLLKMGGFPEVFFSNSLKDLQLWHKERAYRIIYDDIRDLENIKNINQMELLIDALPSRVASPLSMNNLAQDLQVHHNTIKKWLEILDNIYFSFRISPFGPPKIRAVKKEQKLYLWDWSIIEEIGPKFENLVASQLLKYCHFLEDTEGERMELRFLRDRDKREIDFVVLKNKKPLFAVECKSGEKKLSPHIPYFLERTNIPHYYQVHLGSKSYEYSDKVSILPFVDFCKKMGLP